MMTDAFPKNDLLRHLVKTIQYRMDGVLNGAPKDFGGFSIRSGTRTPETVLSHVADVLSFAVEHVAPGSSAQKGVPADWSSQVRRYQAVLYNLDGALSTGSVSDETAKRLTQGPIADVITHVGQLAMLRGLAGAPVPGQVFFTVDLPDVRPGEGE